jgi:hypothetical protein
MGEILCFENGAGKSGNQMFRCNSEFRAIPLAPEPARKALMTWPKRCSTRATSRSSAMHPPQAAGRFQAIET